MNPAVVPPELEVNHEDLKCAVCRVVVKESKGLQASECGHKFCVMCILGKIERTVTCLECKNEGNIKTRFSLQLKRKFDGCRKSFASSYGLTLDPVQQSVAVFSYKDRLIDLPLHVLTYDGELEYKFERRQLAAAEICPGDWSSTFKICYDTKRKVYVIANNLAVDSDQEDYDEAARGSFSLLKFDQQSGKTLHVADDTGLVEEIFYCKENDCYACFCAGRDKPLFLIDPKKGKVIKSFDFKKIVNISVGRLEEKEVIVCLLHVRDGDILKQSGIPTTHGTKILRIINLDGTVVRERIVDSSVRSAEMGPDGIVFFRHFAQAHLSYISVKADDVHNNNFQSGKPEQLEKVVLLALMVYSNGEWSSKEGISITSMRYEHQNMKLVVGATGNWEYPHKEEHEATTYILLHDVVIHE